MNLPRAQPATVRRFFERDSWWPPTGMLPTWLASRLVVLVALLLARSATGSVQASLLGWDAAWYRRIATFGYRGSPAEAIRFFPLWPLIARVVPLVAPGVTLVVSANVLALVYVGLARRVAQSVGLTPPAVDLVPAVVAFAPAAFVLVMGYAEAAYGCLVCTVLLTARNGRWAWCAVVGALAGAVRPTAIVLCLPVLIEACRHARLAAGTSSGGARVLLRGVAAAAAPPAGLAAFLIWCGARYGDVFRPFQAQTSTSLRGGYVVDPLATLVRIVSSVVHGRSDAGDAIHLVWVVLALWLFVVGLRVVPASFTALSAATLALALTAARFGSFERYAGSAVPLLVVAAVLLARHRRLRAVVSIGAPVILFGMATLAFCGWYTP